MSRAGTFTFTTAVNYPRGEIDGWELEARQELGTFANALTGLAVGGNITWMDGSVRLPQEEISRFVQAYGEAPLRTTRDLVGAPDWIYNVFTTYSVPLLGTQLGVFYTRQGDTLVSGASVIPFVPATYRTEFDTLNFSLMQPLGEHVSLTFAAKNLTDAEQREVYRSDYVGGDVLRRLSTDGVEYSLSLGGVVKF